MAACGIDTCVRGMARLANGRCMAISPDATRVAVGMADGSLRVYALHA